MNLFEVALYKCAITSTIKTGCLEETVLSNTDRFDPNVGF